VEQQLITVAVAREPALAVVGQAWLILPHDGAHGDKVVATSYESAIREAQFNVLVIPNRVPSAASPRIETARRLLPRIFFNAETTEGGRPAGACLRACRCVLL